MSRLRFLFAKNINIIITINIRVALSEPSPSFVGAASTRASLGSATMPMPQRAAQGAASSCQVQLRPSSPLSQQSENQQSENSLSLLVCA